MINSITCFSDEFDLSFGDIKLKAEASKLDEYVQSYQNFISKKPKEITEINSPVLEVVKAIGSVSGACPN